MEKVLKVKGNSMKLLAAVIMSLLMMLTTTVVTPKSASAATFSNGKNTFTLPYGNRSVINQVNAGDISHTVVPGWAKLTLLTYITVNDKGVTITKVTQSNTSVWPYSLSDKGTGIITKSSSNRFTSAHSYGKFYVGWNPATRYVPVGYNRTWELHTYAKVLSINKAKRTVTVELSNTASN